MALFQQKKPDVVSSAPLYTLSMSRTFLVVGLGNVGKDFDNTRHNIGFRAIDQFAHDHEMGTWINKKDMNCLVTDKNIGDTKVYLVKPTTMMNLSGNAVQKISNFYKISNAKIIVVHDELDINFGSIKITMGGSSAGHNGIKSIISNLGEDFGRIRIGVGPKTPDQIDSADFVLGRFNKEEEGEMKSLLNEASSLITEAIFSYPFPNETRKFIL
jgi:peptidyl-tRNA hydrolase, PTH1 family